MNGVSARLALFGKAPKDYFVQVVAGFRGSEFIEHGIQSMIKVGYD